MNKELWLGDLCKASCYFCKWQYKCEKWLEQEELQNVALSNKIAAKCEKYSYDSSAED